MGEPIKPTGPDLSRGVTLADIPDGGMLVGQAGGEPILLVRRNNDVNAVGAGCTHYGAPLAEGVLVGEELRCPWHHACFNVRTGDAVGPPALRPIDTWEVVREGDRVRVGQKRAPVNKPPHAGGPTSVVIVGAGAAGDAAADMLRRLGYNGAVNLVTQEELTVDRPNLSKDYLDGSAPEAWIPLRDETYYKDNKISLFTDTEVTHVDAAKHEVRLGNGKTLSYGALVLATGGAPVRLDLPGATLPHVFVLRSLSHSRAIIAAAGKAKKAVVIGASFIGLEAAASLRKRGLDVHVVAPDSAPLARVLGPELGEFVRTVHQDKGVVFHLQRKPAAITPNTVKLDNGEEIAADLVIMGVGVQPNTALAEKAGLTVNNGVMVNRHWQTSEPDIYAVGDIARYPVGNDTWRIEHWVVAQRQGQAVAKHLMGEPTSTFVPYFWSAHYDVPINYVGHAEGWDSIQVAGSIADRDCLVGYKHKGKWVAVASVSRDQACLRAEDALARNDQKALDELLAPNP